MDYIEKMLGEPVIRSPWQGVNKMPYFLTGSYDFQQVNIGKQNCLILTPRNGLGTVGAIKKHIGRIKNDWSEPVVLELQSLSRQRGQTLIAEKIPFIVPGKQLYMPFMGVVLQEKYDAEKTPVAEKFQPSAQMLLFCFIYGKNAPLYLSKMTAKLGFSSMTISRAAAQLKAAGLVEEHKEGVQKVLTSRLTPKGLFDKAKPFLFNPVRRKIYIEKQSVQDNFFLAGLSALARKSMLNAPETEVYGTTKILKSSPVAFYVMDSDKQYEVELWRYDPTVFCGENSVDALSLALSMESISDERVEIAVEELLAKVWG